MFLSLLLPHFLGFLCLPGRLLFHMPDSLARLVSRCFCLAVAKDLWQLMRLQGKFHFHIVLVFFFRVFVFGFGFVEQHKLQQHTKHTLFPLTNFFLNIWWILNFGFFRCSLAHLQAIFCGVLELLFLLCLSVFYVCM